MTRALLAAASAAVLLVLAGPAVAGGGSGIAPQVEDDEKHICVITNSHKREGYCVYTYGIHLPDRP